MILLALLHLTPIPFAPIADAVWRPGDRVEARVEIRMTNRAEDVELAEIENWTLEIPEPKTPAPKGDDAIQATLTRSLLETRLNGSKAGPPDEPARPEPWTFRRDGSLAYRPLSRTALEGRLFRLVEALLPFNGNDPAGRGTVEWPEEVPSGTGAATLPAAVFARDLLRKGPLRPVEVTYRESDVRLAGRVLIDPQNGWPLFWTLRISGLRLEGGDLPVDTVVTMTATKAKIRGENVGLPEKDGKPLG